MGKSPTPSWASRCRRFGLEAEARRAPLAWVQRLGYLLALVEQNELAERLEGVLAASKVFVVPLAPWESIEGAPKDPRWRVAINTDVEPDVMLPEQAIVEWDLLKV